MYTILERLEMVGIVPVIKIERVEDAVPLARALCDGGLPVAEVTFRTACAKDAIREIRTALPHMLVGAGTVLTTKQVDEAIEAGAEFVVSPGLNEQVVRYCQKKGIPILPGCANPSDVEKAITLGLEVVKFFPAEAAGGLPMIKAMSAPYHQMRFMPTGGINEANLESYLAFNKIIACGGSWMVSEELIAQGQFDQIRILTQQAVGKMLGLTFHHMGSAEGVSLGHLMGIQVVGGTALVDVPHVTYAVSNLRRTCGYLTLQGVAYEEKDSDKIVLAERMGGLEVRLIQK
ncbi:MAG: bifunctional 4-hydroxy-2-oxoglutarate aldolase/2-dehydro-3-deoxy-phosphogluconate aldolase [Cellulosilyticaceae bacterium]